MRLRRAALVSGLGLVGPLDCAWSADIYHDQGYFRGPDVSEMRLGEAIRSLELHRSEYSIAEYYGSDIYLLTKDGQKVTVWTDRS